MSNTGFHVVPLFSLFQILPDAMAAYTSEWFSGFTARSAIRPDAQAGPTDLKEIPGKRDDETDGLIWLSDPLVSFFASLFCAHRPPDPASTITINKVRIFFI